MSLRFASFVRLGCFVAAFAVVGCGGEGGSNDASSPKDANDAKADVVTSDAGTQPDTNADVAADTAMDAAASVDLIADLVNLIEVGAETSVDVAGSDVKADTGTDVAKEAGSEVGTPDGGVDGAKDAVAETGTDVAAEAGTDVAAEAGVDAGVDTVDAGSDAVAMCGRIKCDCSLNGIPLWGRYRVVAIGEDFKIRETSFPDLKVLKTDFPTSCGRWREVTIAEDFTVRVVTFGEDFQIQYNAFPGVAKGTNQ